jgi:tRNA(Ile2) C34 agmatinyltransferase TiaS
MSDTPTTYDHEIEDFSGFAFDELEAPSCPACGGETYHLGDLGHRSHFRCCGCGLDCSVEK